MPPLQYQLTQRSKMKNTFAHPGGREFDPGQVPYFRVD